jgi:hypothetical protein
MNDRVGWLAPDHENLKRQPAYIDQAQIVDPGPRVEIVIQHIHLRSGLDHKTCRLGNCDAIDRAGDTKLAVAVKTDRDAGQLERFDQRELGDIINLVRAFGGYGHPSLARVTVPQSRDFSRG